MPKTTAFGSPWMDENNIRLAITKIRQNRIQLDNLIANSNNKLAIHEDSVKRSMADIGPLPGGRSIVAKQVAARRRELAAANRDTRKAYIRELSDNADRVRAAAVHYKSPMQMLMRNTLGSERRSRLLQQLEHSGPAELESLAHLAAAKKDGELAAALCSKVSAMKASDRPFSANDLADVICGDLHRELSQAIVECERRTLEALQSDTEFERGERNAQRSVEIALLRRREAAIGSFQPDDETN